MKKLALLLIALLPLLATAQVGKDDASTAEAFIAQCPELPSAEIMIASGDAAAKIRNDFSQTIKKLFRRIEEVQRPRSQEQADALKAKANEDLKKQGLDFTVDDADNPKAGAALQRKAMEELRRLGIDKSPEEIQNMSEAEKRKLAEQQMQRELGQYKGMSRAEAEKLKGMSNEQLMAYAQQHPELMQQMMSQGTDKKVLSYAQKEEKRQKYLQQIEQLTQPEKEIDRLFANEQAALAKKTAEKWEACEASFPPKTGKMQIEEGDDGWIYVWTEAEQQKVDRLQDQCHLECWTLWRNAVSQQLARIKNLLPNAYKANEIAVKMSQELDGLAIDNNAPFILANKYLETARKYAAGYPCDKELMPNS